VIGRVKNPNLFDRIFSTLIYTVLQKSPGEAAILHGELPEEGVRTILIPYGANIHTRLAFEVAPALAEYFHARVRIAVVFEYGVPKADRDAVIHAIQGIMQANDLAAEIVVVKESDVLQGILRLSKGTDIVLMGGRTAAPFELFFASSLTRQITEQVACPVLWVREYEEQVPFWQSLLLPLKREGGHDE